MWRASEESARSASLDPLPLRSSPDFLTASSGASIQVGLGGRDESSRMSTTQTLSRQGGDSSVGTRKEKAQQYVAGQNADISIMQIS